MVAAAWVCSGDGWSHVATGCLLAHPPPTYASPPTLWTALVYLLLVALADCVTHGKQQPMEGAPHPLSVQDALERNEIVIGPQGAFRKIVGQHNF